MADTSGPAHSPVATRLVEELQAEPWRYSFFAAVHLLEQLHTDRPRMGRTKLPRQDAARLKHETSMAHPSATVAKAEVDAQSRALAISTRFLGLTGPNGPLPLHITEYAFTRLHSEDDSTLVDFLDIFHHRALTLFYRAWADAHPSSQVATNDDRFARYLASLSGVGLDSAEGRTAWSDRAKSHYAGLLVQSHKSAENLQRLLSSQFRTPVTIEQFSGAWDSIPASEASHLGESNGLCVLGQSAVLGERVWMTQGRFRTRIGPMPLRDLIKYLPSGEYHQQFIEVVRQYCGDELQWDMQLVLKRDEIPATRLGRQGRLGMTSWLDPETSAVDNDEVVLRPRL